MKKLVLVIMSALLIFTLGIASTVAWLTTATDKISNTFTIGKIKIDLDEPTWFEGSVNKLVSDKTLTPVTTRDNKLVPGKKLAKDPRAWVIADSEKCYLFVKVESAVGLTGIVTYDIDTSWTALTGETGIYYRVVEASDANQSFPILAGNVIQCTTTATAETLAAVELNAYALSFTAYAVQFEGMTDAAMAWNALNP